jgi:succinate dehydrogenase/fumarate reductase flavoprotein subunit
MDDTVEACEPFGAEDIAQWHLEADVVVVGFGAAGGAAAIEAARAGSEVLVLERAAEGGGASALSGGVLYLGGGTRVQKACGFEDSTEEMYNYVIKAAGPAEEAKVRLYCDRTHEFFAWFEGLGLEFKDSFYAEKCTHPPTDDCLIYSGNEMAHPYTGYAKPAPRGHKARIEGDGGVLIMKKIIAGAQDAGAKVLTGTLVEALVQGKDHRVRGVVAKIEGERRFVRARQGVVLAAGGFIMNKQMVAKHAPHLLACNYPNGTEADDGRGILMGIGAGGAAVHMAEAMATTPFYPPAPHVKGILVNAQGQRFINEDSYHGRSSDTILNRQGGKAYLILDEEIYVQEGCFHKRLAVEETIEDLEKALGLPEASLTATVAYFNEHAAKGEDPVFHKAPKYLRPLSSPPFAALDCSVDNALFAVFTLGGLHTLATGEVLSNSGKIIPGLYAAGRNTAGLPCSGRTYVSGMSLGGAAFFGREAGKSAAQADRC